jgi:uncharacterized protein YjiS (DUF1127 family)
MSIHQTLCSETTAPAPLRTGAIMSLVSNAVLRAGCTLEAWQARAQQRQDLASLSDRMLADIGIDRAGANVEAAKPFWRT